MLTTGAPLIACSVVLVPRARRRRTKEEGALGGPLGDDEDLDQIIYEAPATQVLDGVGNRADGVEQGARDLG
eukprot:5123830-Pyramimonas_sp.AAC.1